MVTDLPPITLDVDIEGAAAFDMLTVLEATELLKYPLAIAIALTVVEADVKVNADVYLVLEAVGAEPSVV